jgi:hypothetical protein
MTDAATREAGAGTGDRALTWAAVLLVTAWLGWVQMSFSGLYDLDSYFHVRAAEQLAAHGPEKTFPQATQSTWRDAYADKDFLFHVLSIPFVVAGDLFAGGKWLVIFLDLLVLASFAAALRSFGLRFGALWVVLLAATSPYYVTRLASVRPHVLGLAIVTLEIALLFRGRWKTLFVVALLHVLAHSSFVLLPALLVARAVQCLVSREAQPWRAYAAVLLGMGVAMLVNPYFPNNLSVASDQLFGVASNVWFANASIPREAFGSELGPMTLQSFLAQSPGWVPAVAGLVLVLALRGVRGFTAAEIYLGFVAAGMLFVASRSRRFLDVFVVGALLFAAALWTRLAAGRTLGELLRTQPAVALPCVLALAGLAVFASYRASGVVDGLQRQAMGDVFAPAVAALDQVAAPEDVVYHASWMDFAVLYAFRPEGRYISGLDPIFLYRHDPALFAKNLDLSRGLGHGKAARMLADDFRARWVYVTMQPRDQQFRALLERSQGVRLAYDDGRAQLWQVLVAPAAAAPVTAPAAR